MTPGNSWPAILDRLGRGVPLSVSAVSGGCIANAQVATFPDGSEVFVKSTGTPGDMFRREAEGLEALQATGAIRVPQVLAVDDEALVLERISSAPRSPGFFSDFGARFARLHRAHGPCCGFPHDNYIGSTPQLNEPLNGPWPVDAGPGVCPGDGADWPGFFMERRLRYQVSLAEQRGHGSELAVLLYRAEGTVLQMLAESMEPPSLLHGDLWSGNFMTGESGEPCLIDPAVYYGHREADLAMTRLFGGFNPDFYTAYEAEWPLSAGHEKRLPIYQLYHLLNHLNLFGSGYYSQCERILHRLVF